MATTSLSSSGADHDVYPLYALDDVKTNHIFLSWIMRFNDVLDELKLHDALLKLLEIGDWRKLGGRVIIKDNGKMEIHVPRPFTAERAAVAFSHNSLIDVSIEEHPVGKQFPKPSEGPSIHPVSTDFRQFAARPNFPESIKDNVRLDASQLSLHVTSFSDATLVSITWPHTLMDALGQQALLRSWSLVLAGRESEVPPVLGVKNDILLEIEAQSDKKTRQDFLLESKRLGTIGVTKLISRFMWDKARNYAPELRMVYLPKDKFSRLLTQARKEAAEDNGGFVSDGDVLTAWATRTVALSEPKPRPITVTSLFNARFQLPSLKSATGVYVQNMTLVAYAFLTAQLATSSVGAIALAHRRHLVEQATEQQTMSFLRTLRKDTDAGKSPRLFFGESDSLPMLFNNLNKAELIKAADFSPAIICQGEKEGTRNNPPGTMVSYYNRPVNQPTGAPNAFWMLGKDFGDNYWLMANFLPRTWTKIEEELENM